MNDIYKELIEKLISMKLTISTAESLTGGLLCANLTSVPGASNAVFCSFTTYCNEAKHQLVDVPEKILQKKGAVSAETAAAMARGAAKVSCTDIAISTTGNAGPSASEGKPVGLVYIAVNIKGNITVQECHFSGDRNMIRNQTCLEAAKLCLTELQRSL